jgi:hypothetical protein
MLPFRAFLFRLSAQKRTSAAKAVESARVYGTAEAVPFVQNRR